jgi:hypothetical protein
MKSIYYAFIICIVLFSCKENQNTLQENRKVILDSVNRPKKVLLNDICLKKTNGYYQRFGVEISNYYRAIKTTPIDFNKDGEIDTIAIIKPFYILPNEYKCFPTNTNDDNILIISQTIKNRSILFKKYDKVIAIKDENLGIEEIKSISNGFIVNGDWGHSNKLFSSIYISYNNNNFFVDSLKIESWGLKQYSKTYKHDNLIYPLSKYKRGIVDSLQTVNEK